MTTFRLGIVAEGITDILVLRHFLEQHVTARHPGVTLHCEALQPATSATMGDGWTRVMGWCLNNGPSARRQRLSKERPLFGGGLSNPPLDALLIVLDADNCEQIQLRNDAADAHNATAPQQPKARLTSVSFIPSSPLPQNRAAFTKAALTEWLWPDASPPDPDHILGVAVMLLETWMVSALEAPPATITEGCESAKVLRRLLEIDCQIKDRPCPPDGKAVNKTEMRYTPLAEQAAKNTAQLLRSCVHFKDMVTALDARISHS